MQLGRREIALSLSGKGGDTLQVTLPPNSFPLVEASKYLLIAGGIGITPILAMMHALAHRRAAFELHVRSWSSVWSNKFRNNTRVQFFGRPSDT